MKHTLRHLTLLAFVLVPALRAETVTWDSMIGQTLNGTVKLTPKTGEPLTRNGRITFTDTTIRFGKHGTTIDRDQLKDVQIMRTERRPLCCDSLLMASLVFFMDVGVIFDGPWASEKLIEIVLLPTTAALSAVGLPSYLAINGVRTLIPQRTAYNVIP
jgi:hypothetical protein